jgi:hypothetical protein
VITHSETESSITPALLDDRKLLQSTPNLDLEGRERKNFFEACGGDKIRMRPAGSLMPAKAYQFRKTRNFLVKAEHAFSERERRFQGHLEIRT